MQCFSDINENGFFRKGVANWVGELNIYTVNYTFSSNNAGVSVMIDHENIGVDTLFVILSCIFFQILSKIGLSVMASLIEWFRGESHGSDTAAMYFCDVGGWPHQPMRSNVPALFTWINLLGSWTIVQGQSLEGILGTFTALLRRRKIWYDALKCEFHNDLKALICSLRFHFRKKLLLFKLWSKMSKTRDWNPLKTFFKIKVSVSGQTQAPFCKSWNTTQKTPIKRTNCASFRNLPVHELTNGSSTVSWHLQSEKKNEISNTTGRCISINQSDLRAWLTFPAKVALLISALCARTPVPAHPHCHGLSLPAAFVLSFLQTTFQCNVPTHSAALPHCCGATGWWKILPWIHTLLDPHDCAGFLQTGHTVLSRYLQPLLCVSRPTLPLFTSPHKHTHTHSPTHLGFRFSLKERRKKKKVFCHPDPSFIVK